MSPSPTTSELRAILTDVTAADRAAIERRLRSLDGAAPPAKRAIQELVDEIGAARSRMAQRRTAVPKAITYPEDLPISEWRPQLLETIRDHQVVIVAGETGSGKSTQLPKLCLELGRGVAGMIAHTQPRRIAARAIAERVAEELGSTVGATVGYTVRFTDAVGDDTLIKVMTDGILLNELQRDRRLLRYDTIIIDEAHERSLNIDFLLGFVKQLLPKRPDLKVIITSATIDTERFSSHFDGAPVVEVSGRAYPVEVRYRPLEALDGSEPRDQTDGIVDAVAELSQEGRGDILVFCSGEREIRDAAEALRGLELAHTEVLPLYGRLSAAEQHRVFSSHTGRRVVVATNVAETSLTVPGVRYVVDSGTARVSRYSRRTKVQRLPIEAISQASADQRAGRCGRLGPGICIRLYSAEDYMSRPEFTDPEILRTNLASVILQMASAGLGAVEEFPFIDPPDTRTIRDGITLLAELGAVRGKRVGKRKWLTDIGEKLARIPVDPRIGRMILAADRERSVREVLIIASALSIVDPRERPSGKEEHATQTHRRFVNDSSDFLTLLNLWSYIEKERRARTSNQFRRMCRDEYLNWRRIREWQDIHAQLRRVADGLGIKANRDSATPELVHRAVLTGLLSQIGTKEADSYLYRGARGARFAINPGSALFKKAPQWVMAAELVETTRLWARVLAGIEPAIVEELGEHLVKRTRSDPWWDRERAAAIANETVTIFGLPLVSDRTVLIHRFDTSAARELFIRHALVLGEWDSHHEFLEHNRAMVEEVAALEARGRRADLLVDEEAMARFYEQRIPGEVFTVRHFDRWWKDARASQPTLLHMTRDDLLAAGTEDVDDDLWPPLWSYGDIDLPLSYEFDRSSPADGVTIEIVDILLDRIDPGILEWNVAGFRLELIAALIKSLPKAKRKLFVPAPDTAQRIAAEVGPNDGPLMDVIRRQLTRISGTPILTEDFDVASIPRYLRPHYRIVDQSGKTVVTGDDLAELRDSIRQDARVVAETTSHPIERDDITDWDFGEVPPTITMSGTGHDVLMYPSLVDQGHSVSIRLLAERQEQIEATWEAQRRLVRLQLPRLPQLTKAVLSTQAGLSLVSSPYSSSEQWMEDCLVCALDHVMAEHGGLARNRADFDRLLLGLRDDLPDVLESVGRYSAEILAVLQRVRLLLSEQNAAAMAPAVGDVADQIEQFIYPGFLAGVGYNRLSDISRYLAAAEYRLKKLPERIARDLEMMQRVRRLEGEHDAAMSSLPWDPQMIEIAWMLQELRVSLFAEPIGANGPVSEKRVRNALNALNAVK